MTKLRATIVHALGAAVASGLDQDDVINQAGRLLSTLHPWNYLLRPPVTLDFAAPIAITGATYTLSSKTVTKSGGFANYTYAVGDVFEDADGTGVTDGDYTIASKTSDNAIVLSTSLGGAADGQTDISGAINFPYVNLPADFGEMVALKYNASVLSCFELVTADEIAAMRASGATPGFTYRGAVVQPSQVNATTAPGPPRLEISPTPTAAVIAALGLWFRATWTEMTYSTGNELPNVPTYMHLPLTELVRIVALGYEEGDNAGISARVSEFVAGPLFAMARDHDGMKQRQYGSIGPGAAAMGGGSGGIGGNWVEVSGPS